MPSQACSDVVAPERDVRSQSVDKRLGRRVHVKSPTGPGAAAAAGQIDNKVTVLDDRPVVFYDVRVGIEGRLRITAEKSVSQFISKIYLNPRSWMLIIC